MLKRVRIEVEGGSAAGVLAELDKYEHALQATEEERYALSHQEGLHWRTWGTSVNERSFFNEQLGREVTDEVIEFCPKDVAVRVETPEQSDWAPGWRGRRVVQYRDLTYRLRHGVVPEPRVVDHWEDRTSYPEAGDGEATTIRDCVASGTTNASKAADYVEARYGDENTTHVAPPPHGGVDHVWLDPDAST